MTRLPALTYREVVRRLRAAGFVFDRQAKGSHEIWYNPQTHHRASPSRHIADRDPSRFTSHVSRFTSHAPTFLMLPKSPVLAAHSTGPMYSSTVSAVSGAGMFSNFILSCGFLAAVRARSMWASLKPGTWLSVVGKPMRFSKAIIASATARPSARPPKWSTSACVYPASWNRRPTRRRGSSMAGAKKTA